MPKFMEKRLDIIKLHQTGVVFDVSGEIAYKSWLWNLTTGYSHPDRKVSSVAVLVGAWVHVQVESTKQLFVLSHFPTFDRVRPYWCISNLSKADAKHPADDLEYTQFYLLVWKVSTELLCIKTILRNFYFFGPKALFPGIDNVGTGQVLLFAFE